MYPFIPKVVLVGEPRSAVLCREDGTQSRAAGVLNLLVTCHCGVGVVHAADGKTVEMLKSPAHRHLDDLVEFLQRAVRRVNAPPDGWVNALQGHFDLKDRGNRLGGPATRNVGRVNLATEQARHLLHDTQDFLLLVSPGSIDRYF